jgi:hypothetical protein
VVCVKLTRTIQGVRVKAYLASLVVDAVCVVVAAFLLRSLCMTIMMHGAGSLGMYYTACRLAIYMFHDHKHIYIQYID